MGQYIKERWGKGIGSAEKACEERLIGKLFYLGGLLICEFRRITWRLGLRKKKMLQIVLKFCVCSGKKRGKKKM